MSLKNLLLAATVLTPFLFGLAGNAVAQDGQPIAQSSDDPITTAEELENAEDTEDGDILNGTPAETPVLQQADETPEEPPAGYNPPLTTPVPQPDWLPSGDPLPRGTAHSWTEAKMEGGECWVYLNTVIVRPDGSTVFYYHNHREPCPPPVATPVNEDPAATAIGLLEGNDDDIGRGPPKDDHPPAHVEPPHAPGIDQVKPGPNGVSYEHHTDGSTVIRDKNGKVTGMIAPAITPHEAKPSVKTDTRTDAPAKGEPTHVGMTNPGVKQSTGTLAQIGHEPIDRRAVESKALAGVQEMHRAESLPVRSMGSSGLSHVAMGEGSMAGLGHVAMSQGPVMGLSHPAMGLGQMGGMAHMGGMMPGGGMHLGGFGMR